MSNDPAPAASDPGAIHLAAATSARTRPFKIIALLVFAFLVFLYIGAAIADHQAEKRAQVNWRLSGRLETAEQRREEGRKERAARQQREDWVVHVLFVIPFVTVVLAGLLWLSHRISVRLLELKNIPSATRAYWIQLPAYAILMAIVGVVLHFYVSLACGGDTRVLPFVRPPPENASLLWGALVATLSLPFGLRAISQFRKALTARDPFWATRLSTRPILTSLPRMQPGDTEVTLEGLYSSYANACARRKLEPLPFEEFTNEYESHRGYEAGITLAKACDYYCPAGVEPVPTYEEYVSYCDSCNGWKLKPEEFEHVVTWRIQLHAQNTAFEFLRLQPNLAHNLVLASEADARASKVAAEKYYPAYAEYVCANRTYLLDEPSFGSVINVYIYPQWSSSEKCLPCDGTGTVFGNCPRCTGSGEVWDVVGEGWDPFVRGVNIRRDYRDPNHYWVMNYMPCPRCSGGRYAKHYPRTCSACDGKGKTTRLHTTELDTETLEVSVVQPTPQPEQPG